MSESRLSRFWRGLKAAYSGTAFGAANGAAIQAAFGGSTSSAGRHVNAETAMTLSAVWSCMRILSETIGSLPWSLYRRGARDDAEKATDHPLNEVLTVSPNVDMTSAEYREALVLSLCRAGNAYSFIEGGGLRGNVSSLYPLTAADVQMKRKQGSNTSLAIPERTVFYTFNDRGRYEDYPREKVWHVKGFGEGLVGLSPLSYAREAIGFALATDEFGSRFFAQGGKPSGIVTIPNFLTKDQRDIARENLQQMLGGVTNAHKFALFEGGMKPEPWGDMPLDDMQFLLLRKFSVQEICRIYRVPPHMVADLEKATFSNIEHQSQEFVQYTLMPYFTRIEASVAKWLLKPEDRKTHFLRFNADGLLRGDSAARGELYSKALTNGWMNRNEVRAKENMNRVELTEMDEYTVQVAMVGIEDMGKTAPVKTF